MKARQILRRMDRKDVVTAPFVDEWVTIMPGHVATGETVGAGRDEADDGSRLRHSTSPSLPTHPTQPLLLPPPTLAPATRFLLVHYCLVLALRACRGCPSAIQGRSWVTGVEAGRGKHPTRGEWVLLTFMSKLSTMPFMTWEMDWKSSAVDHELSATIT